MAEQFTVDWNGKPLSITPREIKGTTVYHCVIDDKQLFLTRATSATDKPFWGFLKHDDKKTAAALGKLIDDHEKKPTDNVLF